MGRVKPIDDFPEEGTPARPDPGEEEEREGGKHPLMQGEDGGEGRRGQVIGTPLFPHGPIQEDQQEETGKPIFRDKAKQEADSKKDSHTDVLFGAVCQK